MSPTPPGLVHPGWGPVIAAVIGALVCGGAGGALTRIDAWYRALRKPSWQPPDWLFGPVWTIIIGLSAWAFVIGWRHAATPGGQVLGRRAFLHQCRPELPVELLLFLHQAA